MTINKDTEEELKKIVKEKLKRDHFFEILRRKSTIVAIVVLQMIILVLLKHVNIDFGSILTRFLFLSVK